MKGFDMISPNSIEGYATSITPLPRRTMQRKRILVVSGGSRAKLAEYRQIHQQGSKIVVLDAPDHWAKIFMQTGLVEAFIEFDLTERESLFDEMINALTNSGLLFDEVITFSDSASPLASRLAYAMGLSDDFDATWQ